MNPQATGRVEAILKSRQGKDKTYTQFVLETDGPYPQYLTFEVDTPPPGVGSRITVQYVVNGRKWTSPEQKVSYFNTLKVLNYFGAP